MDINLIELWAHMGMPVRCVVVLLTLQAVACVAAVFDRALALYLSSSRAQAFAASARPALLASDHAQVLARIGAAKSNHLSEYLEVGVRTFVARRGAGDAPERAAELARRSLERKADGVDRDLNRGMNILASTGSTAPFVGLLGTVLGIINAFKLIAASGSGGIGTIGAAIGEALVVTGYGLVVAIPSVLAFNWLSAKIATYEASMLNAGGELLDMLETGGSGHTTAGEQASEQRVSPAASRATAT